MLIVYALLIGVAGGVLSGMFGIGGGIVMVPLMVYLLNFNQLKAQGTSLAVLSVPVAAAAVINYYRQGQVDLKVAAVIAIAFIVGTFMGSKFTLTLDPVLVRRLFAVLLVIVAAQMFLTAPKGTPKVAEEAAEQGENRAAR